jgi:hypothetical protein
VVRYDGIVGCFGSGGKYVIGQTEGVKDYLLEALNGKCTKRMTGIKKGGAAFGNSTKTPNISRTK